MIKEGVRKIYEEDKAAFNDIGLEGSTISSVEDDQQYIDKLNENNDLNIIDQQQSLWSTYDDDDKNDHLSIKPKEMMIKQTEDFKLYLHKQKYRPVNEDTNEELENQMSNSLASSKASSKKKKEKNDTNELPKRSKKPLPPPISIKHDQHWL